METSSWLEVEGVSEPLHLYSHRVTESTEEFPRAVSHQPVAYFAGCSIALCDSDGDVWLWALPCVWPVPFSPTPEGMDDPACSIVSCVCPAGSEFMPF